MIDPSIATVINTFFGTLPATIGAFLALRQGWKTSDKVNLVNNKMDIAAPKTDGLIRRTDEIHILANGNLARIMDELAAAHSLILELQAQIEVLQSKPANPEPANPVY